MTPSQFRAFGEQHFGPEWQSKLAAALPASDRTIRSWLAGERKIRPLVAARIRSLAAEAGRAV